MRLNTTPFARWSVRAVAGLLCLVVGAPLAATALAQVAGPSVAITGVDSQNFPTDKAALKTAIDQMTAGGNGTVFNEAADKAVNMLAALPPGRKAVVMFTNSGDTANNLSPESILANAQAATVRIYPMAFGTTV